MVCFTVYAVGSEVNWQPSYLKELGLGAQPTVA